MPRSRAACFSCVDDDTTVATLARAIRSHGPWLAGRSTSVYGSRAMNGAVVLADVEKAAGLVQSLLQVDARGGIFAQSTMERAIQTVVDADGLLPTLSSLADPDLSLDQHVAMVAYKVRVLMNHVRSLLDSKCSAPFFKPILDYYRQHSAAAMQSSRRTARLSSRPCPFVNFRSEESLEAGEEEEEAATAVDDDPPCIVAKYFDFSSLRGVLLKSDGSLSLSLSLFHLCFLFLCVCVCVVVGLLCVCWVVVLVGRLALHRFDHLCGQVLARPSWHYRCGVVAGGPHTAGLRLAKQLLEVGGARE